MSYDIQTKLGSELLRNLGTAAGSSVTATDGSVWTRQADGSVVARGVSGDTAVVRDLYTGSAKAAADAVADAASRNQSRLNEWSNLYSSAASAKTSDYLSAAAELAAAQQVAEYNAQKEDTQSQYEKMLRQLYVEREQSEKNLAQLLGAAGLSGGASESTQLGLDTAYINALQEETSERDAALRALDTQIAQAKQNAKIRSLELLADAEKTRISGYADALKAAIAEENNARNAITSQAEFTQQQAQAAQQQANTERSYALNLAQKLLASGGTPSAELLAVAGISDTDADALYVAPETAKPTLTLAQAITAIQNGTVSDAVKEAYDYYMGEGAYDRFAGTVKALKKTASSSKKSSTSESTAEKKAKDLQAVTFTYDKISGSYVWQGKVYQKRNDFVADLKKMDLTTAQIKHIEEQVKQYKLPKIKFE